MLFLLQDCSFDSLGISSVAVYLVDMGNAQMFQPYLYRLADQKCAPVLLFCFFTIKFTFKLKVHAK